MADDGEFKRLNFFHGFFTTADDWNAGETYHVKKRRLHNRALHTPGILRGERQQLNVVCTGGLGLDVLPGAALDAMGNEIYLDTTWHLTVKPVDKDILLYVAIEYAEQPTGYVANENQKDYSGYSRVSEIPKIEIAQSAPDNKTSIELARISLQAGAAEVTSPSDPLHPATNQIDQTQRIYAGSVGAIQPLLLPAVRERLMLEMADARRAYAELDAQFHVPTHSDIRHTALTIDVMVRSGGVLPELMLDLLACLADLEQDAAQEVGRIYPILQAIDRYQDLQARVSELREALGQGQAWEIVANKQRAVTMAVRMLATVVLKVPLARAGDDQAFELKESATEQTVDLDATGSEAFEGRQVVKYRWDRQAE